jgi:outer membrane protein insertion porin family
VSPVGPLKLSFAQPLNAQPTDQKERFQFQLGTGF